VTHLSTFARSAALFGLAGLAEIGGGYLIWLWLREHRSPWLGVGGAAVLALYGVIPTWQPVQGFGRVYAAYGGVFVVASLLWGWLVDGDRPGRYDWIGVAIIAVGVGFIVAGHRRS
jgi:small multidrug resistance family-3 protein